MRICLTIFLLLVYTIVSGQKTIDCEQTWLIDKYFSGDAKAKQQLTKVKEFTLSGKYPEAKKVLDKLEQMSSDMTRAVSWIYRANIAFNESDYRLSIALCDSAIRVIRKRDLSNRYVVKALNLKGKGYGALNEYDKAMASVTEAQALAMSTGDSFGLATSYYYFGTFASDRGEYAVCLDFLKKSMVIRRRIGDQIGLAGCYSFAGLCYSHMDNYVKGIDYIQQSITIRERLNDRRGLANSYLNLYKVYYELGEIEKAMDSEFKSLDICSEIKDLQCVSGRYTNIGQLYQKKGEYSKALNYHFKALRLSKQLDIRNRSALVYENIARVYAATGKYDLGLIYLDSSYMLRSGFGDREGMTSVDLVRADIYLKKKELEAAISTCLIALRESTSLQLPYLRKEASQILSEAYRLKGDNNQAFHYFRQFIHLRDSILNLDQSKEVVRKELEFNFNKQQEMQRMVQVQKEEREKAERQKLWNIILWSSVALIALLLMLGFSIYQYRQKNRSQRELEKVNRELNSSNHELESKSRIIEEQNQEITDSIRYAHRIQSAMLPSAAEFSTYFKDSFVLFHPRDLISGDFYWVHRADQKLIWATVDCTGHGVPGGFMSMLGLSLLNEIVLENGITDPAEVLGRLREKVIASLRQKGVTGEQKDGMDMTLCVYDEQQQKLTAAAANHVFYHVRNGELTEYKGVKQPVGIYGDETKPFVNVEIAITSGDRIFTFSDGLPDQFGGPKEKKFKYSRLREIISGAHDQTIQQLGEVLHSEFTIWKGAQEQTDDVCVIGVEL